MLPSVSASSRRLLGWQGQRLDRELLLALEAQRHPAGGQHLHGRTGRQHRGQEGGRLGHDVLAVVQQQQLLPGPQMLGDPFCQRGVDGRHHPDRAGHGGRHQRRIGKRRQIDPDDPLGKGRGHVGGDGQGETGLANPTGTGQRQERHGLVEEERARASSAHLPGL